MKIDMTCPLCEIGALNEVVFDDTIKHRGQTISVVDLIGLRCDECGEITTSPAQSKVNNLKYADAKRCISRQARSTQGLLAAEQIKQFRELWGLTQSQAARVFGGGPTAFSKYERGVVIQSEAMDLLLRAAVAVPSAAAWLMQRASILPPISPKPNAMSIYSVGMDAAFLNAGSMRPTLHVFSPPCSGSEWHESHLIGNNFGVSRLVVANDDFDDQSGQWQIQKSASGMN